MKKTAFVSSALAVLFASSIAHAQAQVTADVSRYWPPNREITFPAHALI